jgi:hypothetical protein
VQFKSPREARGYGNAALPQSTVIPKLPGTISARESIVAAIGAAFCTMMLPVS